MISCVGRSSIEKVTTFANYRNCLMQPERLTRVQELFEIDSTSGGIRTLRADSSFRGG